MILHLAPDEKFIDFALHEFEKVMPGENRFLVISDNVGEKFKYIKSEQIGKITTAKVNSKQFVNSLKDYEFVVLHMFSMQERAKIKLVLSANSNVKLVWCGWGGDFYHYISGSHEALFLEKTRKLWRQKNKKTRLKNFIKKFLFYKVNHIRAINRLHYFAPVIPVEYDLLKNKLPKFRAEFVPFSYSNLEDMLQGLENHKIDGENILVGNSSSYENNHSEVFDLLEKLDLDQRKVIVPLSYGIEEYRNTILEYGQNALGDSFYPLNDFMNKDEYHQTISSCSVAIMNHLRQQAMGNIITMMYLGAQVFLNPKNPVFDFLKEEGANIFSIGELVTNPKLIFEPLTTEQVTENRRILENYWGSKAVEDKTRKLIATIQKGL